VGACIADRRDRIRFVLSQAWVGACAGAYALGLLVLYLFAFNQNEGPSLVGMGRYLGILALGAACVAFAWALRTAGRSLRGRLGAIVCVLMVLGFGYTMSADGIRFAQGGAMAESTDRQRVQALLGPLVGEMAPSSRVYLVWQGSQGLEFYTSRYELAPRISSRGCWSLGEPRYEGDIWTCALAPETWSRQLAQGFDYVLVARADDRFWADYAALFDTPGGLLYRVGPDGQLAEIVAGDATAAADRLQ
jgi:hypothetical protein